MDEEQIKNLVAYLKCIHCNQHYEPINADVVANYRNLWLFAVYCPCCQIKSLQAVIIQESVLSEQVTELSEAEQAKFSKPICSDDVIDLHLFMKDFNGDFIFFFSLNNAQSGNP